MLGKGLESLIPAGGYRKPDESKETEGTEENQTIQGDSLYVNQQPGDAQPMWLERNPSAGQAQPFIPSPETSVPIQPQAEAVSLSAPNQIYNAPTFASAFPIQESEMKPALREEPEIDYSRGQASVFQIEVEKIFPNPHQPRRHFDEGSLTELANSIREFGIIQPLVVTKILKETENGTEVTYQLIAGERRLMAAKKVGLRTVPAVIKRIGMDRERLELAIIENIQREDLNPLEAARGYARLQDEFGLTQREIAIRMGKSRETIANTLRLLNLPSDIQQALEERKINESHARLLLQIEDIARQKEMFQSIIRSRPSVRELKATIRKGKMNPASSYLNPELISLQSRLEEFLGTKAQINDEGGKGKITINYYSPEELNALINRLSGEDF
ncbi:MAG: ParB/RepB/Spo0J family partition protein [Parcubacteria group bacterium]